MRHIAIVLTIAFIRMFYVCMTKDVSDLYWNTMDFVGAMLGITVIYLLVKQSAKDEDTKEC